MSDVELRRQNGFLSTPSARRATSRRQAVRCSTAISIHALREEGDAEHKLSERDLEISIHALREEGDDNTTERGRIQKYFYPRPPRGGRRRSFLQHGLQLCISIHALREEGDSWTVAPTPTPTNISIHALREEGDQAGMGEEPQGDRFLSTPSARRATRGAGTHPGAHGFLSTPSARRATWKKAVSPTAKPYFYPRPPRGGRRQNYTVDDYAKEFLSTPSARRATVASC